MIKCARSAAASSSADGARLERGSVVPQLLGMAERFAEPSVFLTVSPDDAHQAMSE